MGKLFTECANCLSEAHLSETQHCCLAICWSDTLLIPWMSRPLVYACILRVSKSGEQMFHKSQENTPQTVFHLFSIHFNCWQSCSIEDTVAYLLYTQSECGSACPRAFVSEPQQRVSNDSKMLCWCIVDQKMCSNGIRNIAASKISSVIECAVIHTQSASL